MIATASGAMLAGVAEAEPSRMWFGRGGRVEQHDEGSCAVFVRGELLGVYGREDVAFGDVYIAVVLDQASREDLALAFRGSVATLVRVTSGRSPPPSSTRRTCSRRRTWPAGTRTCGYQPLAQCA